MSASILNWVPTVDGKGEFQEARLGQCVFKIRKTKHGYSLHGKGVLPPDGGFDIQAGGSEASMKQHAETMASAYVHVTGMPLNCVDWNAKHPHSMRVKVAHSHVKKGVAGRTVDSAFECEGVHFIGIQFASNGLTAPVRLDSVTVIGPVE